jgi:hypothetical protein
MVLAMLGLESRFRGGAGDSHLPEAQSGRKSADPFRDLSRRDPSGGARKGSSASQAARAGLGMAFG